MDSQTQEPVWGMHSESVSEFVCGRHADVSGQGERQTFMSSNSLYAVGSTTYQPGGLPEGQTV